MIVILFGLVVSEFTIPVKANPSWWEGWNYRQSHDITYAGSESNYQIFFNVYKGEGSSSGDSVYLNDHCESFPNDINFTDSSNNPYYCWTEDSNTTWAGIWVNITSVPTTDMYVYYGNIEQTSFGNDGVNTFLEFSHFDGSEVPPTGWTLTPIGVQKFSEDQANSWFRLYDFTSSSAAWSGRYLWKSISEITGGFKAKAKLSTNVPTQAPGQGMVVFMLLSDSTENFQIGYNDGWTSTFGSRISYITGTSGSSAGNTEDGAVDLIVEIEKAGATGTAKTYYNGVEQQTKDSVSATFNKIQFDLRGAAHVSDQEAKVDYFYIRKYVVPEPAHGDWGIEEEPYISKSFLTFYNSSGGIFRVDNATVANGTEIEYDNDTLIEFEIVAIVEGNMTYGFNNFTWNGNYNYTNPYNFSYIIIANTTLWIYFGEIIVGNGETVYIDVPQYTWMFYVGVVTLIIGLAYVVENERGKG